MAIMANAAGVRPPAAAAAGAGPAGAATCAESGMKENISLAASWLSKAMVTRFRLTGGSNGASGESEKETEASRSSACWMQFSGTFTRARLVNRPNLRRSPSSRRMSGCRRASPSPRKPKGPPLSVTARTYLTWYMGIRLVDCGLRETAKPLDAWLRRAISSPTVSWWPSSPMSTWSLVSAFLMRMPTMVRRS
jgi:hypothetical protein